MSKEDAQFAQDAIRLLENRTNSTYDGVPREILEVCLQDAFMLIRKNKLYGDSALNPVRLFSTADPAEQIRVRLDDKMSRIKSQGLHGGDDGEDTAADLRGYLVLEEIAHRRSKKK